MHCHAEASMLVRAWCMACDNTLGCPPWAREVIEVTTAWRVARVQLRASELAGVMAWRHVGALHELDACEGAALGELLHRASRPSTRVLGCEKAQPMILVEKGATAAPLHPRRSSDVG